MSDKWKIQEYHSYDKSFVIDGPLPLIIDNDDVWHPGVALLSQQIVDILNNNWSPLYALRCNNEDCPEVGNYFNVNFCPVCNEPTKSDEVLAS